MTTEYFKTFWNEPTLQKSWSRMGRSQYLLQVIQNLRIDPWSRILEIGSGTGRNLVYLFNHGYVMLAGIERDRQAYEFSVRQSMDLIELTHVDVTKFLFMPNWYDVIFTMATLQHIPDVERLAWCMQKASRQYIITLEDEMRSGPVHFPRQYDKVFRKGYKQVKHQKLGEAQGFAKRGFVLRVMKKKT